MRRPALVALLLVSPIPAALAQQPGPDRGPFPRNEISAQPTIDLPGGHAALAPTVAALQRSLTALQQMDAEIRQARWNVSGTLFHPLRQMLEAQHQTLDHDIDLCAERLLAIGASADGRIATIARTKGLPELPGGFLDDAQVLTWFTLAYKALGEDILAAAKEVAPLDPASASLLEAIERDVARAQWQMRAEFQSTATDPNRGTDINGGKPVEGLGR